MVVIAGTSYNMYAASNNKETGLWLPLALAIMIILRLPNQICVAKNERDGWLSVFGSTMGLISYIATVIIILHYNKKKNDGPGPGPGPGSYDLTMGYGDLKSDDVLEESNKKHTNKIKHNTKTMLNMSTFL